MRSILFIILFHVALCQKDLGCGIRRVNSRKLIKNGYDTLPGEWPWHAAIFHKKVKSSNYACGGTLINQYAVLTAAHCVTESNFEMNPDRVLIQLGRFELGLMGPNVQEHKAYQIYSHENFNEIRNLHDIAIVILATKARLNDYVQPACIWPKTDADVDSVVGVEGLVIGWGFTEDDELSMALKEATMPIVGLLQCLNSNRDFFGRYISEDMYCAGRRNGTTVCPGDSGGGMFIKKSNAWFLRGIVSFASAKRGVVCNSEDYAGFTNVAKYLDWILQYTTETKKVRRLIGAKKCRLYSPIQETEFPYRALIIKNSGLNCDGVLISSEYVLTTAECVSLNSKDDYVDVGSFESYQNYSINATIRHPESNNNNIALIRLNIDNSTNVIRRPICLPIDEFDEFKDLKKFSHFSSNGVMKGVFSNDVRLVDRDACVTVNDDRKVDSYEFCSPQKYAFIIQEDGRRVYIHSLYSRSGPLIVYVPISPYVDWIESIIWPNEY